MKMKMKKIIIKTIVFCNKENSSGIIKQRNYFIVADWSGSQELQVVIGLFNCLIIVSDNSIFFSETVHILFSC